MKFLHQIQQAFLMATSDSREVSKRFFALRNDETLTDEKMDNLADSMLRCKGATSIQALVKMMIISQHDGYDAFSPFSIEGRDRLQEAINKVVEKGKAQDALYLADLAPLDMAGPLRRKILESNDPQVLYAYTRTFLCKSNNHDLTTVQSRLIAGAEKGSPEYAVAAFQLAQALDLPVDRQRLMTAINAPSLDKSQMLDAMDAYAESLAQHGSDLHAARFVQNALYVKEMDSITQRHLPESADIWSRNLPNAELVDTQMARKIIGEAAQAYQASGEPVPASLVRASSAVSTKAAQVSDSVGGMHNSPLTLATGLVHKNSIELTEAAIEAKNKTLSSPSMG